MSKCSFATWNVFHCYDHHKYTCNGRCGCIINRRRCVTSSAIPNDALDGDCTESIQALYNIQYSTLCYVRNDSKLIGQSAKWHGACGRLQSRTAQCTVSILLASTCDKVTSVHSLVLCLHAFIRGAYAFRFVSFSLSLSHTLILVPCPCGHANFVVAYLSSRTITTTKLNVNFILHAEIMPSMCCCMTVPVNKCEIMYA